MSIPKAEIPAFVAAEQVLVYNSVAAGAFILWDQCITFGQEVELIWKYKFSLVNFLFFVIRYLSLVIRIAYFVFYPNTNNLINPSVATCVKWLWFQALSGQILFIAVEVLLIIRVLAFYGRKKVLLICILAAFLFETAAELAIVGIIVPRTVIVPSPLPRTLDPRACIILSVPDIFNNYWVPGLLFESVLFILVVVQFVRVKRTQTGIDSSHILVVFVRDGTWAFILLFALLLWASLTFELSTQKGDIALTWIYSILAFCGTRLTLNLRMAAHHKPDHDITTELRVRSRYSGDSEETRLVSSGDVTVV